MEFEEECLKIKGKELSSMGNNMIKATKTLRETADWLLETWKKDRRAAAAGATPFLDMCGNIFGGWMMIKTALKASQLIRNGETTDYLKDKISSASNLIKAIRSENKNKSFYALELGNFFTLKLDFNNALDEYLIYVSEKPKNLSPKTQKLMAI